MACRKRCVGELGKPHCAPIELFSIQVGRRKAAICLWGVLSGIVLRGWESQPHAMARLRQCRQGKGPDGSTQPAKETRAGHVGLDEHEPTSLRGIATGSCNG